MAIQSKEAQALNQRCQTLQQQLTQAQTRLEQARENVTDAAQALAEREVFHILAKIPVEELNREKRGIRVKTLRDSGYETAADLARASRNQLAAINGISPEGAEAIAAFTEELHAQAREGIRIRLSEDDKSSEATDLVAAVHRFRTLEPAAREAHRLNKTHYGAIRQELGDLYPALKTLRWLFASRSVKRQAEAAFEALQTQLQTSYGTKADWVVSQMHLADSITPQDAWQAFSRDSIRFFNTIETLCPGLLGTDQGIYGLPETLAWEIQQEPLHLDGLRCELRRYQQWGVKYILHQQRVLLGDEMGLGKTVQAIAAMVSLHNTGAGWFMVVCPASVLENWCREIRRHSNLAVFRLHGPDRQEALQAWEAGGGVAVTTYETTASLSLQKQIDLLTVDEAHYIKNPGTQRTANVKRLCAQARRLLFMTGTALENRVEEMLALIGILQPPIAEAGKELASLTAAPQFRETVAPVYYRRRREEVLKELPELTDSREWCRLSGEEEQIYEQAVLEGRFADARRVSWSAPDPGKACKAQRMLEIVEEAEEEGRKVIVFSFFLDTIAKVTQLLAGRCTEAIDGSVPPQHRQEIVDQFDQAPAGTVLPAQILSGGTGLNIQSASVVILCEPQFKPSTENQAISRAYRMGQTRSVLVYRLLCEDTVDEQITALLEEKQQAFDAFADQSAAAEDSRELDEITFRKIMQQEEARIQAKHQTP